MSFRQCDPCNERAADGRGQCKFCQCPKPSSTARCRGVTGRGYHRRSCFESSFFGR
jgi:hypothetical protein